MGELSEFSRKPFSFPAPLYIVQLEKLPHFTNHPRVCGNESPQLEILLRTKRHIHRNWQSNLNVAKKDLIIKLKALSLKPYFSQTMRKYELFSFD